MNQRDQNVFLKAAGRFNAWILVRQTNPSSFQYKGKAVYQPKPISCKPKTAGVSLGRPDKQVDGLVADPYRWREAFSADKIAEARDLWDGFRRLYGFGEYVRTPEGFEFKGRSSSMGFAIDIQPRSLHEGCLTLEGKYLYGDYDLFDIIFLMKPLQNLQGAQRGAYKQRTGPEHAPAFGTLDNRDENWDEISQFINQQLGVPMIQHGSHLRHKPHDFRDVDAFGPGGVYEKWDAATVRMKYTYGCPS
jgi:hypothetical protein